MKKINKTTTKSTPVSLGKHLIFLTLTKILREGPVEESRQSPDMEIREWMLE